MSIPRNPTVTVVLPTLNEQAYIRDALDSLARQDYESIDEILIVDGMSIDRTREIAGRPIAISVRVIDNPGVTAAAAMNAGLANCSSDILVRADAHTVYKADYVRRCVEVLVETGAANVGGPMRAVGTNRFGRAVAAVTSSPVGVGPGRFHYARGRHEVETVYLGCWWRSTLEELGGWDETTLQWAAEDQELNYRIRSAGGQIILDSSIRSAYFPRDSALSLRRQYFNYGMAKASTLAKHGSLPYLRPIVPAAMVGASLALLMAPFRRPRLGLRLALPISHLAVSGGLAALKFGRVTGVRPADAWAALVVCHWSYGAGFLNGLVRIACRRPFDSKPQGRR